jgi:hypothetical protein
VREPDDTTDTAALPGHARFGSGLATIYRALDLLVADRGLDDAAVVVEVPPLGRQVLHAGRRPLRDDEHGLLTREPGLHVIPEPTGTGAADDTIVTELMLALAELALRHDATRVYFDAASGAEP